MSQEDKLEQFDAEQADDPIALFRVWMAKAVETEVNDPEAVALATATTDGVPSARMVLMKRVDERGFSFYTNAESRKGRELAANPRAAMCFHWKTQRRQVRVEGTVRELPGDDADAYFHSRGRRSQIGALASAQSRPLASRADLEAKARELAELYPGEVPRPEYWRGYCLEPKRIEFWQQGNDRLHDRIVFARDSDGWSKARLFP
jgi:pyridoxamine 5'-phosphate oxidase